MATYVFNSQIHGATMVRKVMIVFLAGLFLTAGPLTAGNRRANRLFELYRYSSAIPLYLKAAESGNEATRREAVGRLADCYRLTNDIREARNWYARAVAFDNPEPEHYLHLGQALRSLSQYAQAREAFLTYATLKPQDVRGKILAGYCDQVQMLSGLPESVQIRNAEELNSLSSDFSPVLYREGVVFTSDRKTDRLDEKIYEWTNSGYLDLYYADFLSAGDPWPGMGSPEKMPQLFNQAWHDGPASFTKDQTMVFLTRTLKSKVGKDAGNLRTHLLKLFYSVLDGSGKADFLPLPFNSDLYSVGHPAISGDGTRLVFSSDMPGGYGGSDLYLTGFDGSNWSEPVNLGPLVNSFGNDVFPTWVGDTALCFASDGHPGFGGLDLYETFLTGGAWSDPVNMLKPVNSPYDDFGLVYMPEDNKGFFSSNRPGGKGSDDIFTFRGYARPEEVVREEAPLVAGGYVKDKQTGLPLGNATVFVLNSHTNEVAILKTTPEGYFETPVQKGLLYVAKAMMPGYFDDCLNFRFPAEDISAPLKVPRDLLLDRYSVNQVFRIENIYYDLDKWFIREDARPALDNLVRNMNQFPINIELSSHTDSRANDEYNMELSEKRAESAVRYLVMNGIDASRLIAKGYGESRLVNQCRNGVPCSEAEHQANRRTEFKILSVDARKAEQPEFDPSGFVHGDVIPVQLLAADFFKGCLESGAGSAGVEPVSVPGTTPGASQRTVTPITGTAEPFEEPESLSGDTYFAVQIYAVDKNSDISKLNFKGEEAFSKPVGEFLKFYVGKFDTFRAANRERLRLKDQFPGAFIVAFYEGEQIPVKDLRTILE